MDTSKNTSMAADLGFEDSTDAYKGGDISGSTASPNKSGGGELIYD